MHIFRTSLFKIFYPYRDFKGIFEISRFKCLWKIQNFAVFLKGIHLDKYQTNKFLFITLAWKKIKNFIVRLYSNWYNDSFLLNEIKITNCFKVPSFSFNDLKIKNIYMINNHFWCYHAHIKSTSVNEMFLNKLWYSTLPCRENIM